MRVNAQSTIKKGKQISSDTQMNTITFSSMQKDVLIQRKTSYLNFTLVFSNVQIWENIWIFDFGPITAYPQPQPVCLSLFIFVYSLWLSFPSPGKLLMISQRTRNNLEVVGKSFINKYLANRCLYSYGYQFPLGWNGSLRRTVMDGVTRRGGLVLSGKF